MSHAKLPDQSSRISVLTTTVIQTPHVLILWRLTPVAAMKDTLVMVLAVKPSQLKTNVHWVAMIVPTMLLVLILSTVMNAHVIQDSKITHVTLRIFLAENVKPWVAAEYFE